MCSGNILNEVIIILNGYKFVSIHFIIIWSQKLSKIMIPSFLKLYVIYIFILLKIIPIFCDDLNDQIQELEVKEPIFGYDFTMLLEMDIVLIWRISGNCEPFKPLQHNGYDIHFGSEETYLILTQTSHLWFTVYYWLGGNTTLAYKQVVAKYAVLLSGKQYGTVKISRETEGMESDSFQFTMIDRCRPMDSVLDYIHLHLPSPQPNLYVVLGERHSRIKKIPISLGLNWLRRKDTCLVLEVEYNEKNMVTISYFCGSGANEKQIDRSMRFANKFFGEICNIWERQSYLIEKLTKDFKQFIEYLEDNKFYKPNEVDDSRDHLKDAADFVNDRDVEVMLFDVMSNGLNLNLKRPNRSSIFHQSNTIGHLLDTKSVAGVFLILPGTYYFDILAIQQAEKYMDDIYPLSSGRIVKMRILEKYPHANVLDFEINLSDYPLLDWTLPEDELW